ncbi:periplasmic heavy metal sensor [Paracoccaceae bacterium GXU_MW_L88]
MPFTMTLKKLRYLLLASVLVNVILAGVVLGPLVSADRKPPPPPPGDLVAGMIHALPEAAKDEMRRDFRERRKGPENRREERAAQVRAITTAVEAEPFDPAALEAALQAFQMRTDEDLSNLRSKLIEQVGEMTPEERADFAEKLRDHGARGKKGRK